MRIDSSGNVQVGGSQNGQIFLGNGSGAGGQRCNMTFTGTGNEFFDIGIKGSASQFGHIRFNTGTTPTERVRIDSSGRLLIGSSTVQAHANMDDLQVGDGTGNRGITISSVNTGFGTLAFGDSTDGSGTDMYAGFIEYYHNDNSLRFGTASSQKIAIDSSGHITPGANGTQDLGSTSKRFANLYTSDLDLSNEAKGGNDVDGTWGAYTIQEGEEDLFLINKRSGKKYKFMLQEVS